MNGTGVNIKLGSGGFLSTMLGGGIALIVTHGLIEAQSNSPSKNLYFLGAGLIGLSIFWYALLLIYKLLHPNKIDIK